MLFSWTYYKKSNVINTFLLIVVKTVKFYLEKWYPCKHSINMLSKLFMDLIFTVWKILRAMITVLLWNEGWVMYEQAYIPAILVIFALWILLQLALGGDVFKNPLNYFILIMVFFLFIKQAKEK